MGIFEIAVAVGDKDGIDWHQAGVTVDVGASDTLLPAPFLAQSSVEPVDEDPVELANGAMEIWPMEEALRLVADPVHRALTPAPPLRARPIKPLRGGHNAPLPS